MSKQQKIVVFDLDETLGNFIELGMFCDALDNYTKTKMTTPHFFEIIDLFHHFLRPNIIKILDFLIKKRRQQKCDKIMIYTNNNGPRTWAENISKYFQHKLKEKVFDEIIAAFKVNGKQVEICRTSHDKSVDDLIRCTKIPANTKICFLDDQYHPQMKHSNVFYINVKPYTYSYEFNDMAEMYYNKFSSKLTHQTDLEMFKKHIHDFMSDYNYDVITKDENELKVDKVISKKLIQHLKNFLSTSDKTKKNKQKRTITQKRKNLYH